mmetsp:Transcript_23500/g.36186  ORF Transcript_23500/g.36186 Transcript_23500/m.36186 type:complete len:236 (+) Transcript_23500:449-1156(+)
MKQKKQFTTSKTKSIQHYNTRNLQRLCDVLSDFKMVYQARHIVDCMDQLQLYNEKLRRTIIRAQVRSDLHRKKFYFTAMKGFIKVMARNQEAKYLCKKHLEKKNKIKLRRFFSVIRRVNAFERKWLESVRMELYFSARIQDIFENLKTNIKYERAVRAGNTRRCATFLHLLAIPTEKTRRKWQGLSSKFDRQKARLVLRAIRRNVGMQKRKRLFQRKMNEFRKLQLVKQGFNLLL